MIFDERCLGLHGSQCPDCENSLNPQVGEWIARNPSATWGEGYWINHLMVPWLNYDEILDRHRTYDLARFKNEVLGLSSIIGEHIVTRAELEACCSDTPMAKSIADIPSTLIPRYKVIAGIDWGGGGTSRTVVVIGIMRDDYIFQVFRFVRFAPDEDPDRVLNAVSKECQKFKVEWIAADGGGNG